METLTPVPLDTVSAETFAPHVGTVFSMTIPVHFPDTGTVEARTLALSLTGVRQRGATTNPLPSRRESFSLTFNGPADVALSQHIYPLHHPDAGLMEIFLVPIGVSAEGRIYEAVFN